MNKYNFFFYFFSLSLSLSLSFVELICFLSSRGWWEKNLAFRSSLFTSIICCHILRMHAFHDLVANGTVSDTTLVIIGCGHNLYFALLTNYVVAGQYAVRYTILLLLALVASNGVFKPGTAASKISLQILGSNPLFTAQFFTKEFMVEAKANVASVWEFNRLALFALA